MTKPVPSSVKWGILEREGQAADTREFPRDGSGYHYQIAAVSEAIRAGLQEHPLMPLAETVTTLKIMDTLRRSWVCIIPMNDIAHFVEEPAA